MQQRAEPTGDGGSLCSAGEGSFAGRAIYSSQAQAQPQPPDKKEMTRIFPFWPALSKRNATLSSNTWEMKLSDSTEQYRNSQKHPGFFSPNLILPRKIPSFLDINVDVCSHETMSTSLCLHH